MAIELLSGNDTAIRVRNLREATSRSALNNQTLSGQVLDAAGAALGSPVSFSLAYVAGSSGDYEGYVPASAALTVGTAYLVRLSVSAGPGLTGQWDLPATAVRRERAE